MLSGPATPIMPRHSFALSDAPSTVAVVANQATFARPDESIMLTVRIDGLDALQYRLALHRVVGGDTGVYVVKVDHRRQLTTIELSLSSSRLSTVMDRLMAELPCAEFGAVRAIQAGLLH